MRDNKQQTVKVELLSQWKLEAEFRNILCWHLNVHCPWTWPGHLKTSIQLSLRELMGPPVYGGLVLTSTLAPKDSNQVGGRISLVSLASGCRWSAGCRLEFCARSRSQIALLRRKSGAYSAGCMEASDKSKSRILRFHSSDPDSATAITVQIPSSLPQLHLVLPTSRWVVKIPKLQPCM